MDEDDADSLDGVDTTDPPVGAEMADTTDVDTERAASALGSLADEDRIAILLALREDGPRSFVDLQAAAGFEDSGRFNYHLDRLVGRFVQKSDRGYDLRAAGAKAVDVVTDERFGESPAAVDRPADADCPNCGSELRARYEDENVEIACPDCAVLVHYGYFPPRGRTTRVADDLFDAYGKRLWRDFTLADRGVCPYCSGRMETQVERDSDHHLHYPAVSDCRDCGAEIATAVGLRLLADPAVVAFLYDHGVGVDDRPFWELEFCIDDSAVSVVADDPLRVVVPIERGDETLRVTVDEQGRVVETARTKRR
ncbi:hypothetical protein SAMN04487948_102543 [Halogranum amylolyticum]|uniref:Uncharacterized protein n=1 Tax=Halogranum amylolyticum TaxID=660520 RepID=A0A1H8PXI8_9EURY|nr:transcriptional regulator [Halogranum amylolyticum]SEO46471.1 hypothetical protein SAMN04487948_102543 [Halogranum amylolyticum]